MRRRGPLIALLALAAAGCGGGDDSSGDGDRGKDATTTRVEVIERSGQQSGGFDPKAIYESEAPGVVTVISLFGSGGLDSVLGDGEGGGGGVGSGFVLDGEGEIATNAHVVTTGEGDAIRLPASSEEVHYEGELAVVIGTPARNVTRENALQHVFGYCAANDVTARDQQRADVQFTRAKSYDSFCPLGPWVETVLDASDLRVVTRVNGQVKQDGRTSQMIHDIKAQIAFVSSVMTLLPGDVILTGTPAGVGPIVAGDTVSVEIEGIGTLTNPVVPA